MIQRTISAMVGKGSINHNCRKFTAENVDPSRSHLKSSRRILVLSNMSQTGGFSACFFILCSQGIFHMSVQWAQSPLFFHILPVCGEGHILVRPILIRVLSLD